MPLQHVSLPTYIHACTHRNEESIAPAKAKAIQRLLLDLGGELRGVALPLVNAFAIPDHILRAPIGLLGTDTAGAAGVAASGGGAGVGPGGGADSLQVMDRMYREYLLAAGFDA